MAYDRLSKNKTWRWDVNNTIGGSQVLQYSGDGDETVSLSGTTFPSHNGNEPVENLIAEADKKEPLLMVGATGDVLGRFIIESVQIEESNFHVSGLAHLAGFTISIRRYLNDG